MAAVTWYTLTMIVWGGRRVLGSYGAFMSMASTGTAAQATSSVVVDPFAPHWALYPRTYVVQRSPHGFQVDGDITKPVWQDVPWSEPFGDIQGDDAANNATKSALTRFKMLYDDTHVYVAAELQPSPNMTTEAHYTERNSPIYQRDSDFEVFIDVDASCQSYKELEINALNTVWNLMLDRPYADGGQEHSARQHQPGDDRYYEVHHQITATRIVHGILNDVNRNGATWTVEMALAYNDLYVGTAQIMSSAAPPPRPGTAWRINFSRVERRGHINWTWQPQITWDPAQHCYRGFVDMHRPDAWGYLWFAADNHADDTNYYYNDAWWPSHVGAYMIYYAQHAYWDVHGEFTHAMADLDDLVDAAIMAPLLHVQLRTTDNATRFVAWVGQGSRDDDEPVVQITDQRVVSLVHGRDIALSWR